MILYVYSKTEGTTVRQYLINLRLVSQVVRVDERITFYSIGDPEGCRIDFMDSISATRQFDTIKRLMETT